MDYSKGGFRGKVGCHYGERQNGRLQLKKTPTAIPKHTQTQTSAVRAFEKLTRFSSAVASVAFNFLGIKRGKLLKHTATAKYFKGLIENHTFDFHNFGDYFEQDSSIILHIFSRSSDGRSFQVSAKNLAPFDHKNGSAWFVFVFDPDFRALLATAPDSQDFSATVSANPEIFGTFRAVVFRVEKRANRRFFFGLFSAIDVTGALIFNGVWHLANSRNPSAYIIEENRIICADPESEIVGKIAKVR